jgi:HEAT repeat protein
MVTPRTPSAPRPGRPQPDAIADRRRAAALAGHQDDATTARDLLDDPEPAVRATALGALQRLSQLGADELAAAMADPSPVMRGRGAEVAAAWPGDEPPSLAGLLADPDPVVAEVAAWAAGERQPPEPATVAPLIAMATGHDDALCREAAVAALGAIGDPVGLDAVLAATADKATVRRRAVIALAAFEGPRVDAALEAARTDRDWQVRQAAEDLLD